MLLKAEADPRIYQANQNSKLIPTVVSDQKRLAIASPEPKADYFKLVAWLQEHGESVEQARKDLARWHSWSKLGDLKKIRELREAKIAERMAKERAENGEATTPEVDNPRAE